MICSKKTLQCQNAKLNRKFDKGIRNKYSFVLRKNVKIISKILNFLIFF